MDRHDLEQRLYQQPVLSELPDSKAREDIEDLLRHPGFYHLYGLLLGARQGYLVALSQAPLANTGEVQRAGVLQGTIRGIEIIRDTVLEQTIPSPDEA